MKNLKGDRSSFFCKPIGWLVIWRSSTKSQWTYTPHLTCRTKKQAIAIYEKYFQYHGYKFSSQFVKQGILDVVRIGVEEKGESDA